MRNKHHITNKLHIKKGDVVEIIAGDDRKKRGEVLEVFPKDYRAIVKAVRLVSKHKKPTAQNPKGAIIRMEAPVHLSNLMLIDPATKQPTRVGRKLNDKGRLQRYSKKTNELIKND